MIIVKGHLNLVNMHSYINFVMTSVILVFNVLTSTHLVTYFIATRIYLFLVYLLTSLIGPTKSNPHFTNGSSRKLVTRFVKL